MLGHNVISKIDKAIDWVEANYCRECWGLIGVADLREFTNPAKSGAVSVSRETLRVYP